MLPQDVVSLSQVLLGPCRRNTIPKRLDFLFVLSPSVELRIHPGSLFLSPFSCSIAPFDPLCDHVDPPQTRTLPTAHRSRTHKAFRSLNKDAFSKTHTMSLLVIAPCRKSFPLSLLPYSPLPSPAPTSKTPPALCFLNQGSRSLENSDVIRVSVLLPKILKWGVLVLRAHP